ncbi:MAG: hypothetical protein QOE21_717, partial [Microbacteriaceae bacterium]|nr:hypothetical protein [Microbacteriaceae bacterium]
TSTNAIPIAKRGSNQNERGPRSRAFVMPLSFIRRLPTHGMHPHGGSMLASEDASVGKLSTSPSGAPPRAHNRGMNDIESASGLGRFLTLADTAEILNVSASQTYALVRSGELPAIKVGGSGHWRVERSVLESYIEAKYEESRRLSLWNQSNYADLPELFGAPRSTPRR